MIAVDFPKSQKIHTLFSYDTEFTADSVEWCKHEPYHNFFVCANYQLIDCENHVSDIPKKRVGRILLFSISPENGLTLHQTIDTHAILDQKWCHNKVNDFSILGVVNDHNTIEIYNFNTDSIQLQLIASSKISADNDNTETLLLSLDWNTGKFEFENPEIVCSDSKGKIHRWTFSNNSLILEQSYKGHDFEAWIAGFYYWNSNIFFSGGDDSLFLKFDKRVGYEPVSKNRSHEAGVTSFHSNISKEYIIATGSYDSNIRLWDMRYFKSALNSLKMPGTLWRLKWDPFTQNYLLAACMLGGVHIVCTFTDSLKIGESYYEHKNISYGADWSYLEEPVISKYEHSGNVVIGTCSFYDHLLCVSRLEISKGPA